MVIALNACCLQVGVEERPSVAAPPRIAKCQRRAGRQSFQIKQKLFRILGQQLRQRCCAYSFGAASEELGCMRIGCNYAVGVRRDEQNQLLKLICKMLEAGICGARFRAGTK